MAYACGGRIAAGGGLFAGELFANGLIAGGLFASGLNAAPRKYIGPTLTACNITMSYKNSSPTKIQRCLFNSKFVMNKSEILSDDKRTNAFYVLWSMLLYCRQITSVPDLLVLVVCLCAMFAQYVGCGVDQCIWKHYKQREVGLLCRQKFVADKTIDFVGGGVPIDEPECGFDGSRCKFHMGTVGFNEIPCRCHGLSLGQIVIRSVISLCWPINT